MHLEQALQGKRSVEASELYMAFELGEKNWKLALDIAAAGYMRRLLLVFDRPEHGGQARR